MEDDHDLDLQIFRNFQIAIGKFLEATSCSYLQQPSLSPSPQIPNPKSQVPSPKSQVQEAGKPCMPCVVPAGSAPAAW